MGQKKHKHARRTVAFYKLHHGFKEPFKILVDGNFLHATLGANLPHLDQLLGRLLGGAVKLYTTRCVTRELMGMGPETAVAAAAARALPLHKCCHRGAVGDGGGEGDGAAAAAAAAAASGSNISSSNSNPVVPAADCLLAAVGKDNAEHWWVATQDRALRAALERVRPAASASAAKAGSAAAAEAAAAAATAGAVPCLFASVNGLHLADPPSAAKRRVDKEQHAARRGLTDGERAALEARTPEEEEHERRQREQRQQQHGSGGSIKFRRKKRASGPNPLAVRRKKSAAGAGPGSEAASAGGGVAKKQQQQQQPKRRKRSGGGGGAKAAAAAGADGGGGGKAASGGGAAG